MIKVQDWVASIPEEEKHVAYTGEGKSETREFLLCGEGWETYRQWGFFLDMAFDPESVAERDRRQVVEKRTNTTKNTDATGINTQEVTTTESYTVEGSAPAENLTDIAPLTKTVTGEGLLLTWQVLCQHTQRTGRLRANLRAVGPDTQQVKKSAMMVFEVEPSVGATAQADPPALNEFEQMEARITQLCEQAYMSADTAVSAASGAVQGQQQAASAAASTAIIAEGVQTKYTHILDATEQCDRYATAAEAAAKRAESAGGGLPVKKVLNYAFAIADKDGKVALGVDEQGNVVYVGQNAKPLKQNGNYDAEINMFICYGQSWSTGYDASAITTEPRYDNLMLDTGIKNEPLANLDAVATSFVPAVEVTGWSSDAHNQKVGETPVTAQMNVVKQLMESEDGLTIHDLSYQLLGTAPGMGSKTLTQLEKGTDYYARLIAQVQQAHDIATAMGKRLVVQAFSWVQGALGKTGNYADALEQLRLDIDTDVKAITGQKQDVKCITWQSFIYNGSLRAKQVYDQYVGAAETYPNIICAGATYHLDNVKAGNLHFKSESQDWLGAYFGVAYKRTVIDGEGFEPLKPIKVDKSGKILYVKFNVPQKPLVFDTERLSEAPNKGFKLYATDGAEKTIADVAIVAPDMVKIVCADDVVSTDRLTYGEITTASYQWVGDNHGNLRDSQGDAIRYESGIGTSLPLHNWCVIFDKTIAELED